MSSYNITLNNPLQTVSNHRTVAQTALQAQRRRDKLDREAYRRRQKAIARQQATLGQPLEVQLRRRPVHP